jgi:hypothetical protein
MIPHPLPPNCHTNLIERASDPKLLKISGAIDGSASSPLSYGRHQDVQSSIVTNPRIPLLGRTGVLEQASPRRTRIEAILRANPQGACDIYAEVFQRQLSSARILTSSSSFCLSGDAGKRFAWLEMP